MSRVKGPDRASQDVVEATHRLVDALQRRASEGDDTAALGLLALAKYTARAAGVGLEAAHRGAAAYSYGELATFAGVSRQAIRQRARRATAQAPEIES